MFVSGYDAGASRRFVGDAATNHFIPDTVPFE